VSFQEGASVVRKRLRMLTFRRGGERVLLTPRPVEATVSAP
jgi:hypothetical protein